MFATLLGMSEPKNIAYQTPRRPRPDKRTMAIHAIRVLEQAMRDAWEAPIALTPAVELALDTLQDARLAEDHQTGRFVEGLTTNRAAVGTVDEYMRHTSMEQMVFTWRSEFRKRDEEARQRGTVIPDEPFPR